MLKSLSIKAKMSFFLVLIVLVAAIVIVGFSIGLSKIEEQSVENTKTLMLENQKEKLQISVHSMAMAIKSRIANLETEEEKHKVIRDMVKDIRFFKDKSGYFFVNDGTVAVANPAAPKIVGKDMKGINSNGVFFVKEFQNVVESQGSGFVEYVWPKVIDGQKIDTPKISFVEGVEGTRYIVGSGVYLDNIAEEEAKISNIISSLVSKYQSGIIIFVFIFLVVIVIPLTILIIRSVTGPITKTKDMLHEISEGDGDLTVRLEIDSEDEIGQLASNFNTFVAKLQTSFSEVAENAISLSSSSSMLQAAYSELEGSMEKTNEQTNNIASAAEEISVNVNNVTDTTENMSSNVNSIASATEEMSSNVNTVAVAIEELTSSLLEVSKNTIRAASIADDAAKNASSTSGIMSHLDKASGEIGKILDVINDIADQTNLLALNATIEAASAGEAGKGFAVVANEVKELAKQTANATDEITSQISDMQSRTNEAVEAIKSITTIIDEINSITNTIATAVEEQTATTNEISRSVGGAAQGANEVSSSVQELNLNIEENVLRSTKEAANGVQEVSRNIQIVSNTAAETVEAIKMSSEITERLGDLTKSLDRVVSQFKFEQSSFEAIED